MDCRHVSCLLYKNGLSKSIANVESQQMQRLKEKYSFWKESWENVLLKSFREMFYKNHSTLKNKRR